MVIFGGFLIAAICFFLDVSFLKNFGINALFPVFSLTFFVLISSKDKSYWSLFIAIVLGLALDGASDIKMPVYLILFSLIYVINRYFVAGVLSYGQTKQSLITLGVSILLIFTFNYQGLYSNLIVSKWFIIDIVFNIIYLLVIFYLLRTVLSKFFEKYEKYLAERFR
jgi:predicted neutral ceramidase superfamily lipid hydrolase